ncbi:MAG TPA: hypothetical protein VJM11_16930 [Nevskiaceae bacterium]|nr:hypothetical protein [Nevskiaceae bacterium]
MPSTPDGAPLPADRVRIARANLYLACAVCDAHLAGVERVALREHAGDIWIAPSADGVPLKVRNARGDRVIHAQDFFRVHGFVDEFHERECPARWDAGHAALVIEGVARVKRPRDES